ncbi:MAG: alpha-glucan family phosphorylase [Bacteroidetes bacterium]|nr:alpha-glucan family phosphorylase [Bacteroidota bacterium]
MPRSIATYQVAPSLPEKISQLRELAYNLYWSWNMDVFELFMRLDEDLWESTQHNPVEMLGMISQERLEEVANDNGFISHMYRAFNQLQEYLFEPTWYQQNFNKSNKSVIAYFSAEYGLTDCLKLYSGGLGVLSGDHLKSASDLGLPLVGIGLAYKEGYFQQYLNSEGWQLETYPINDFHNLPMNLAVDSKNQLVKIAVDFPNGKVICQIWKVTVGRIPLFLLDSNIAENIPEYRNITSGLYRGTKETRIQQEILLGIGGIRALAALGYHPEVCHMNEGHSAFLALERIRITMKELNLNFREAMQIGYLSSVFTTHTPVPAGIDIFSSELVEKYFRHFREELGLSYDDFMRLGNLDSLPTNSFNMAHLAMKMSGNINGVSELHSKVSRNMWSFGWKGIPVDEIPIRFITNGVHIRSNISHDIDDLYIRYLGDSWINNPVDFSVWNKINKIPDIELWRTHERRRERLVAFARENLQKQLIRQGAPNSEIMKASEVLDPNALTIGFARRFATYKRATLIFKDLTRLKRILLNEERPAQLIFAGKAHPQDEEGKKLIKDIYILSKDPQLRRKIVFLENYDLNIARYLVQGCDIWLNTPRRPLEASGTSGMKSVANGGLQLSILDGWWCEGYKAELGWSIGLGEEYTETKYQDDVEANLLYQLLEDEVVPLFYKRGSDNLPREWIGKMKNSLKDLTAFFNSNRMVQQYLTEFYDPIMTIREKYSKDKWTKIKEFVNWKNKIESVWSNVKVEKIKSKSEGEISVGQNLAIQCDVFLGEIDPSEVSVEIFFGKLNGTEEIHHGQITAMAHSKKLDNGWRLFKGEIPNTKSGLMGYTIRVLPKHEMMTHKFETGLIYWTQ